MSKRCDLTDVRIMTGNNVPKSKHRTRRTFLPNLKKVSLTSNVLNSLYLLKIAAKTLRTINKYGDLDAFLINTKQSNLSEKAKKIKKNVLNKLKENNTLSDVKVERKSKIKKSSLLSKRKKKLLANKAENKQ